jgi:hypothetical protein
MGSAVTASANIAVGAFSLQLCTSGANNVAVGQAALQNNKASFNVAVGSQALDVCTTGASNTAVGFDALGSSTTGGTNVGLGKGAGFAITTGSNNVFVGTDSGNDAVRTITTASNEGVFGNNATVGLYVKVAWTVTSDIRDKTNIGAVPHGLDFVSKVNPIKYQYKKSRQDDVPTGLVRYGFSAQQILELEGSDPVIVNAEDSENLKITDQNLIAILVNAVKELKAELDAVKSELNAIKGA